MRLGAPRFMLHDLRKLVATVGEKLELDSSMLIAILVMTRSPRNSQSTLKFIPAWKYAAPSGSLTPRWTRLVLLELSASTAHSADFL